MGSGLSGLWIGLGSGADFIFATNERATREALSEENVNPKGDQAENKRHLGDNAFNLPLAPALGANTHKVVFNDAVAFAVVGVRFPSAERGPPLLCENELFAACELLILLVDVAVGPNIGAVATLDRDVLLEGVCLTEALAAGDTADVDFTKVVVGCLVEASKGRWLVALWE